jgi:hypothetical protein
VSPRRLAAGRRSGTTSFELSLWAEELATFAALGAFRVADYSVSAEGGGAAPAAATQVSASVFEMLDAVPLHGRTLNRQDERPGSREPEPARAARPMVEEFRMRRCYPPTATMFGGTDVE